MKVFITGATGYIGSALTQALIARGYEVKALARSRKRAAFLEAWGVRIVEGNLSDEASLDSLCEGAEAGFHLAGYVKASGTPEDYDEANVEGARRVFEAALRAKTGKLVFTSSAGVLGPTLSGDPVKEGTPRCVDFLNDYERTKAQAETLIPGFLARGLPLVSVNPTRVFGCPVGPDMPPYTGMIDRYLRGKFLLIPGDGKSFGNYVYLRDVVAGHLAALDKGTPGERYLLGGQDVTYRGFFEELGKAAGISRRLPAVPAWMLYSAAGIAGAAARISGGRPLITPSWVKRFLYDWKVSSEKAERGLGYAITPLPEALRETVEGLRRRGEY